VALGCWAPATVPVTMRAMAGAGLQQALQLVGRNREVSAVEQLTPQELQIAGLAMISQNTHGVSADGVMDEFSMPTAAHPA